MSEVKRYTFKGAAGYYVYSKDFDRVTAERDALQQRLTAADERADVLEGLLANAYETAAKWVEKRCDDYVNEHGSIDPETGTVEFPGDGEEYVGELMEIAEGLRAIKPAEGGGDGRNYHFETGPYEVELGREKWAAVHEVFKTFNNSDTPDEDFTCSECELNGLVSGILIELKLAAPE